MLCNFSALKVQSPKNLISGFIPLLLTQYFQQMQKNIQLVALSTLNQPIPHTDTHLNQIYTCNDQCGTESLTKKLQT